jgi:hypothetical protein
MKIDSDFPGRGSGCMQEAMLERVLRGSGFGLRASELVKLLDLGISGLSWLAGAIARRTIGRCDRTVAVGAWVIILV